MSFAAVVAWSLLRAAFVASLAVPFTRWQDAWVRRYAGLARRWRLTLLLVPLFAPDLLVGYAYARFDLSLLHRPAWNETFYLLLMMLKFLPAGLVLRLLAPPPLQSAEADHCRWLLSRATDARQTRFARRARGTPATGVAVAALVFLLAFQEFEVASEMSVVAWTVDLFDSQAGGLNLDVLLRRAVVPAAVQLSAASVLVVVLVRWWRHTRLPDSGADATAATGIANAVALVSGLGGCVLLWGVPIGLVATSGLRAVRATVNNPSLVRSFVPELAVAVILAAAAGTGAAVLSAWLARRLQKPAAAGGLAEAQSLYQRQPHCLGPADQSRPETSLSPSAAVRSGAGRALIVLVAGLFIAAGSLGSLVLSAAVLAALQWPWLIILRDSVLPLVTVLILFLLPRGLFLFLIVAPALRSESRYVAALLAGAHGQRRGARGAGLLWSTGPRRELLLGGLLAWWAFLNLTATAMLCPASIGFPGTTGAVVPLPVRLYNLMHYGRNGPLSLMTLASVVLPLLLFVFVEWIAARVWSRRLRVRAARLVR